MEKDIGGGGEGNRIGKLVQPLCVVTPLSKYLALALFILLPFGGFWLGVLYGQDSLYESMIEVTPAVAPTTVSGDIVETELEATATTSATVYMSADNSYSFEYPTGINVRPISTSSEMIAGGNVVRNYPSDSVMVADSLVISKIPYSDIGEENPIFNYDSCCSGTKYSYDADSKLWQATTIAYEDTPSVTVPLIYAGECTIERTFGGNKFFVTVSGDEGVATHYWYFLMTDKGYAIRFDSLINLEDNFYDSYAPKVTPKQADIDGIKRILASVTLGSGIQTERAGCK